MSQHTDPWHQFWTRSLDAATGVAGSAESLPGLTTQWWAQSLQASQQWWSWWFAAFMPPADWGAQDEVGRVPPPPASEPVHHEAVRHAAPRPGPRAPGVPPRRARAR